MRKAILFLGLMIFAMGAFAYCNSNVAIANASVFGWSGLSGTPANVTAKLWTVGSADWATNGTLQVSAGTCTAGGTTGGCDSDGVGSVTDETGVCGFGNESILHADPTDSCGFGFGPGDYMVITDLSYLGFDGCPAVSGRCAILAYDTAGNYALESMTVGVASAWDGIGNITATPLNSPFGTQAQGSAAGLLNVTWDPLNAHDGIGACAAGDCPASALATQFRVYTLTTAAAAPASFATSAWVAGATYPISTGSTIDMAVPLPTANQYTYLSRSLIFDGFELPFVSTAYVTLYNPSGAPVISSILASKVGLETNVTWTSSDESRVANYQIFWAPVGGQYSAIGSAIQPMGNNHTYLQSVRIPATGNFNVKVVANLVDGTTQDSTVASVKASSVIKNRSRVVPN